MNSRMDGWTEGWMDGIFRSRLMEIKGRGGKSDFSLPPVSLFCFIIFPLPCLSIPFPLPLKDSKLLDWSVCLKFPFPLPFPVLSLPRGSVSPPRPSSLPLSQVCFLPSLFPSFHPSVHSSLLSFPSFLPRSGKGKKRKKESNQRNKRECEEL